MTTCFSCVPVYALQKSLIIICAADVCIGGEQLAGISFPVVVLDEGSQCAEPEALIPLTKVSGSVIVLLSD